MGLPELLEVQFLGKDLNPLPRRARGSTKLVALSCSALLCAVYGVRKGFLFFDQQSAIIRRNSFVAHARQQRSRSFAPAMVLGRFIAGRFPVCRRERCLRVLRMTCWQGGTAW